MVKSYIIAVMKAVSNKEIPSIVTLCILTVIFLFYNTWFKTIFIINTLIAFVYFATVVSLIFAYLRNKSYFTELFLCLYLVLAIFQITTTQYANEYTLTPHEVNLQIQRMNTYPPKLARLGHFLEVKKEIQILGKVENNFFNVLNFNRYFPDFFTLYSFPFSLVGLYLFVGKGSKLLSAALISTIILLTFLGVNGKYGPFLIFPFFVLFIYISLIEILKKLKAV
jgi:hypothetical protein